MVALHFLHDTLPAPTNLMRTQGTFYCRVNQLHLLAPGWEDADQKATWKPPPGFLRWLRDQGPVVGCKVRGQKEE